MLKNDSNPVCGILYIDDEEKALKYFRMAFSQKFTVFTASSGAEGLALIRREAGNIGIVISDQRMPGMLGAEILGIVREEFPRIVRILTTAYSDLESAIQAVNKGHIYQYVVKPWEVPELGMVLQRAADYFQVLAERNELLALKLHTLQRLVCSDRVKGLLLAARSWPDDRQTALRCALGALVDGLPPTADSLHPASPTFRPRDFEIGALMRGEYHTGGRVLDALTQAGSGSECLQALVAEWSGTPGAPPIGLLEEDSQRWVLELNVGVAPWDLAGFLRTLFGALIEREIPPVSLAVLRALFALAPAGGSLVFRVAGEPDIATFTLTGTPASPDEIIDRLYEKFSGWDIAGR